MGRIIAPQVEKKQMLLFNCGDYKYPPNVKKREGAAGPLLPSPVQNNRPQAEAARNPSPSPRVGFIIVRPAGIVNVFLAKKSLFSVFDK